MSDHYIFVVYFSIRKIPCAGVHLELWRILTLIPIQVFRLLFFSGFFFWLHKFCWLRFRPMLRCAWPQFSKSNQKQNGSFQSSTFFKASFVCFSRDFIAHDINIIYQARNKSIFCKKKMFFFFFSQARQKKEQNTV